VAIAGPAADWPRATVAVPDGVEMVARPTAPDIRIYDFFAEGRTLLGIYLGDKPSFPPDRPSAQSEDEFVGGIPAKTIVEQRPTGWSRDLIVRLPPRHAYHFFYQDLRDRDLALADSIIGSLQIEGASR